MSPSHCSVSDPPCSLCRGIWEPPGVVRPHCHSAALPASAALRQDTERHDHHQRRLESSRGEGRNELAPRQARGGHCERPTEGVTSRKASRDGRCLARFWQVVRKRFNLYPDNPLVILDQETSNAFVTLKPQGTWGERKEPAAVSHAMTGGLPLPCLRPLRYFPARDIPQAGRRSAHQQCVERGSRGGGGRSFLPDLTSSSRKCVGTVVAVFSAPPPPAACRARGAA